MKKNILLLLMAFLFCLSNMYGQVTPTSGTRDGRDYVVNNLGDTLWDNQIKGMTLTTLLSWMYTSGQPSGNKNYRQLENEMGFKYDGLGTGKAGKKIRLWFVSFGSVFAGVPGESESYSGSVMGVFAGIHAPILTTEKNLAVTAGMEYSMEGSKYTSNDYIPGGNYSESENKVRLNYMRLPILARKYTQSGFYGEAGIQPGILLSAKDKFGGETASLKSDYKGFDLGLRFGVGYEFKQRIGVHANFAPGISNINKKGGPNDGKKDRNQSISFGLNYYL
jgi:Outer membrane protein beta-barrel domain